MVLPTYLCIHTLSECSSTTVRLKNTETMNSEQLFGYENFVFFTWQAVLLAKALRKYKKTNWKYIENSE
jgi:hypothetical protein